MKNLNSGSRIYLKNSSNKFMLLLKKGVYPQEYKDDLDKFNETLLPNNENFCSNLNTEGIKDSNCNYPKRFCKTLK